MSMSFPISYKSENNSIMRKYYQLENSPSTIKLETDICLKNLLRQISTTAISNLDSNLYNVSSNVIVETTTYAQNLSIEDPNCSITNPTTFCIASNYSQLTISNNPSDNQSHVINVSNNFKNNPNTLSTVIQLATDNSPIFDTDITITTDNNTTNLFNAVDDSYTALFDDTSSKLFISKLINSGYNNSTNNSLLTIGEDTDFNNNYALGNAKDTYYVKNVTTNKLDANIMDNSYSTIGNMIDINIDSTKIDVKSIGCYRINISESVVNVSYSDINVQDFFVIGNNDNNDNIVSISELGNVYFYQQLLDDISSGNSFGITVNNNLELNNGINFTNNNDESLFTINNTAMIGNIAFMDKIIYPNKPLSINLTQLPMTITSTSQSITTADTANNNILSLTTDGETLDVTKYNIDGEIVLQVMSITDRITIIDQSPGKYFDIMVDYTTITDELKNNLNVSYDITNKLIHTGNGKYGSVTDDNGTSVFMNTTSSINLTSTIANQDDEIVLIKVSPFNVLTNYFEEGLNNNLLYILDDNTNNPDVSIDAYVYIDINGDLSSFEPNYDLRFKVFPKTVSQLNITATGDINTKNNLLVTETNTNTVNNSDTWILNYAINTPQYIVSDIETYSSENYFPAASDCIDICNGDLTTVDIVLDYISNTNNNAYTNSYDKAVITCNGQTYTVTQEKINKTVNYTNLQNTYEDLGSITYSKGVTYKVIKQIIIDKYNAIFPFNLAGTQNLYLTSPLLKSIITKYYLYPTTATFTFSENYSSYSVKDGRVINRTVTLFTPEEIEQLATIKTITLFSDAVTIPQINFTVNKQSLTYLNGSMQYRNKNNDDSFTNWDNIGPIIENLEPYLGTNYTVTNFNNCTITVGIIPNYTSNEGLILSSPGYFTPLTLKNDDTNSIISGYKYSVDNVLNNFPNTFDPNYFLDSSLIEGETVLNLTTEITYTNPDLTQGSAKYTAIMNIIDLDNNNVIATININQPTFNVPVVIAKISQDLFKIVKTVETEQTTTYLPGSRFVNNGNLDLSDGVKLKYQNIENSSYINFSLNSDKLGIQHIKNDENQPTVPNFISSLTISNVGCESLLLPFYRGYNTDDETIAKTYTYKISRSNLVSCTMSSDIYAYNFPDGININKQNIISFDNGVGSIGVTITPLFSRLPSSLLSNGTYIMPLTVTSDSITITRTIGGGTPTITEHFLQDYKLYTFINGQVLKPRSLRVANTINTEYYNFTYDKSNIIVYYNNKYVGNPADIPLSNWGNKIATVPFSLATLGFKIGSGSTGLNTNGFLTITLNQNSTHNTNTYFVVACPQLKATQMGVNGVKNVFSDKTNTSVYDESQLVTQYFPVLPDINNPTIVVRDFTSFIEYYPFSNIDNINNVIFRTYNRQPILSYINTPNAVPVYFNITGSSIIIQEFANNLATKNGPNQDGIIFNGLISDLINLPEYNVFYPYINLESMVNGQLKLTYTQDNRNYYNTVFSNSNVKPSNNMKFIVGNCFVSTGQYILSSSITKGVKISIYDMVKRDNDIVLLKYEQSNIDFTNIPVNTTINQINFVPTKVYKSIVSVPVTQFGSKYIDKFNNITSANMQLDSSGNIIWTEFVSDTLLNNFSLKIKAINTVGLNNMIEIMYATSEIPTNFTVFNQSNIMEMLTADGTPKFIITPFGQIQTPSINSKDVTIYDLNLTSNVEILKANATILNDLE